MNRFVYFLTCYSLSTSLLVAATAVSADDPAVNRLLASQCAQCHGTNGYSSGGFEGVAGEDPKDMFEDLTDMKGEDRPEDIMDHQALGYTDDQIRRIADYYGGLPEERGEEEEKEESHEEEH